MEKIIPGANVPAFDAAKAYAYFRKTGSLPRNADQLDEMAAVAQAAGDDKWRLFIARAANTERVNEELSKPAKERSLYFQELSTTKKGIVVAGGEGVKSKIAHESLSPEKLARFAKRLLTFAETTYQGPGEVYSYNDAEEATTEEATPESAGDASVQGEPIEVTTPEPAKANGRK